MENLAAERLPDWDVTTAAYGRRNTGQVQQIPWWNRWIRHRRPKLVVLVIVSNDFIDNADAMPGFAHAQRAEDGGITLVPPATVAWEPAEGWSRYDECRCLGMRSLGVVWRVVPPTYFTVWLRSRWAAAARRWVPEPEPDLGGPGPGAALRFRQSPLPYDSLFTGFALDQWKERTRQSGASLLVLATAENGYGRLSVLNALAAARRIPVVSQREHILRRGGQLTDARWPHDWHWSPQGHQWAAEAILAWLAANPAVCRR